MRTLTKLALAAALLLPLSLPAQVTFERTYGGALDDYGFSAQQTRDGGFVVAGATHSFGAGSMDVYLAKTNPFGDTVWTRAFGGVDYDAGHSVQETNDGGFAVAGLTFSYPGVHTDMLLIKTDTGGVMQWMRTYGGTDTEEAQSVQQTRDSGFILTGFTRSFGLEDYKAYLVKTKPNGDTEWTRTYGGTNYDVGYSVQQTDDGGYIVAGITGSYGAGLDDLYLIKTDAYGDTLWTRTCGGTDMDQGYSVQQTADGGYVACGCTFSPSAPSESDIYIVKTDAHGNTLWARTYGDSGIDRCFSVQQTTDGGFILAGETVPLGAYQYDVYIVRTDSTGDVLWSKTYGGPSADRSSAVKRTADGGYVIAGRSNSFGIGDYDIYLIKTDSLGNVGVAEPRRPQAASPKLQAEPNPCRSSTVLRWTPGPLDPSTPVLRVFDATGRLVLSQPVRTSPFPLSTSGLAAGAYFLRVSSGGRAASTRLVVTR